MKCQICGSENPAEAKFCNACGIQFSHALHHDDVRALLSRPAIASDVNEVIVKKDKSTRWKLVGLFLMKTVVLLLVIGICGFLVTIAFPNSGRATSWSYAVRYALFLPGMLHLPATYALWALWGRRGAVVGSTISLFYIVPTVIFTDMTQMAEAIPLICVLVRIAWVGVFSCILVFCKRFEVKRRYVICAGFAVAIFALSGYFINVLPSGRNARGIKEVSLHTTVKNDSRTSNRRNKFARQDTSKTDTSARLASELDQQAILMNQDYIKDQQDQQIYLLRQQLQLLEENAERQKLQAYKQHLEETIQQDSNLPWVRVGSSIIQTLDGCQLWLMDNEEYVLDRRMPNWHAGDRIEVFRAGNGRHHFRKEKDKSSVGGAISPSKLFSDATRQLLGR